MIQKMPPIQLQKGEISQISHPGCAWNRLNSPFEKESKKIRNYESFLKNDSKNQQIQNFQMKKIHKSEIFDTNKSEKHQTMYSSSS